MDASQWLHTKKTIEFVALILIAVGALNWGTIGLAGFNMVEWASRYTTPMIQPIVYTLVGLSALYFIFKRDYFLPFLGETVFPCEPLAEKSPDKADAVVEIHVKPNSNVIYWAAENDEKVHGKDPKEKKESATERIVENPWKAYMKFENSGVARSDDKGRAVLRVRRPVTYRVPFSGRALDKHIHYRVCGENGMLGRIETVKYV
jgi:uncharacterized membrane protein YuzA (DUF378 family)